jgi:cation:H+ antiporter
VIFAWIAALVAGLAATIFSSRQTLDSARSLARALNLSPFIIGMTVVAIGTDLPEIANSITASATDHGDINVGDSIGSVVTQITLVLGILCFIRPLKSDRQFVAIAGFITVIAVLIGAAFLDDGFLSRTDGFVLIAFWLVGTFAVQRRGRIETAHQPTLFSRSALASVRDLFVGLGGVAIGAVIAVRAFTEIAADLNVPEYTTSFLVLSLGTSLPELAIDGYALRNGESSLALGDIVGSSFVDATLSLGIGPALFPVAVSADAVTGSIVAAIVVAGAIALLLLRSTHDRRSGLVLFGLYAAAYAFILA